MAKWQIYKEIHVNEIHVNKMHAIYDKHHKVSPSLKSHQNTHNSVKYEVMWKWHFMMFIDKEYWISLVCISGHKCQVIMIP